MPHTDPDVSKSSACFRNWTAVYLQFRERRESAEMGSRLFSLGPQVPMLLTGRTYFVVACPIRAFSAAVLVSLACHSTVLQMGGLDDQFIVSHFWRLEIQGRGFSGVGASWFLVAHDHLLAVSSQGLTCTCASLVSLYVLNFLFSGYPNHFIFNLVTSLKALSSNTVTLQDTRD